MAGLTRTYQGEEPQRINRWLAQEGVCSRRTAEDLIARGAISVEGAPVTDLGHKILPGETLTLSEAAATTLEAAYTIVLNKPVGYVSAHADGDQIAAAKLITRANRQGHGDVPENALGLPPLGRLDQDSRGLLLLSNDGVLAKAVIGPESDMEKEYIVKVKGRVNRKVLRFLRDGMVLDGKRLQPAIVEPEGEGLLRFTLREGRKRQIRRMCEVVDLRVRDLKRVRIGPLDVGRLAEGRWRYLTPEERKALLSSPPPAHSPQKQSNQRDEHGNRSNRPA